MIKVSIIVPAYNVEQYIEKCLETLVNQTLKEIEIIIVNDGSTDNTKQKIQQYIEKYPDKIIYLEKQNRRTFRRTKLWYTTCEAENT